MPRRRILLSGLHRFTKPYGLCRYTANLYLCLRRIESLDVTLVLGSWQRNYYRDALNLDVDDPQIRWVSLKRPGVSRYWWYLSGMSKLARELQADIVHALFPMPLLRQRFRAGIVTTMHDLYAYDTPEAIGFPNVYVNKLVTRMGIAASDEVVSISIFTRDRLEYWFPKLKRRMALPVIYQDVRIAVDPAARERPLAEPYLLCVAQHRKNKNIDLVIQAFYRALDEGVLREGTQLVVVGSGGTETETLRAMTVERGSVQFLSSIADAELAQLYASCELLVCASSIEGFCLPVVEALLLRCRVVCADIPILREVAGEQGTFFALEPRSAEAVVQAIQQSLSSDRHAGPLSKLLGTDAGEAWTALYGDVLRKRKGTEAATPLKASDVFKEAP